MTPRTVVTALAMAAAVFLLYRWQSDPHRTRLPLGSTDLSTVAPALAKLPAGERALIEAYVMRSGGDVLPPGFADPDQPLTARTFGDAITLQRTWEARMKVEEERAVQRQAQRDAQLEPLRRLVDASVVKAEIVARAGTAATGATSKRPTPGGLDASGQAFVVHVRVRNFGHEAIVALRGSLNARDSRSSLPMDLCWVELRGDPALAPQGQADITCGHPFRGASAQNADFIDDASGRFRVVWEPSYVKLSSGLELKVGL